LKLLRFWGRILEKNGITTPYKQKRWVKFFRLESTARQVRGDVSSPPLRPRAVRTDMQYCMSASCQQGVTFGMGLFVRSASF